MMSELPHSNDQRHCVDQEKENQKLKKASSSCTYITAAGDTDEYECIVKTRTIKKLSVYNLINCT